MFCAYYSVSWIPRLILSYLFIVAFQFVSVVNIGSVSSKLEVDWMINLFKCILLKIDGNYLVGVFVIAVVAP